MVTGNLEMEEIGLGGKCEACGERGDVVDFEGV